MPRRRMSPRSPRKPGPGRKRSSWTTRSTTTTPLSRNRKKRTPMSPTSSAATSKTRRKGKRRAGSPVGRELGAPPLAHAGESAADDKADISNADVIDRVRRLHLLEHRGHFASRLQYSRKRTSAEHAPRP